MFTFSLFMHEYIQSQMILRDFQLLYTKKTDCMNHVLVSIGSVWEVWQVLT